ncbi:MAG: hypothetical protein R2705_18020 [Ilumatobacteraceae bacterium]
MVPSRYGTRDELIALCTVLADFPGTSIEFIPKVGPFGDDVAQLMADMSVAAKAPLNWNVLAVGAKNLDERPRGSWAPATSPRREGKVVGLTAPMSLDFGSASSAGSSSTPSPDGKRRCSSGRGEARAVPRSTSAPV